MGLRETLNPNFNKLTFKYSSVNQKERNMIKIHDSMFTMGVQRSNYLQVDNELMANLHENPAKVRAMTQNKVAQRKDRNGRQFDLSKHLYN